MDCIFCKILAGEIPSSVIYEDEDCLAFHDIEAQAPIHFLVVPKIHCANLEEMAQEHPTVLGRIMAKIPQIAAKQGAMEYRVVNNNGLSAGQTVFHLHFHVLSGRNLSWPPG